MVMIKYRDGIRVSIRLEERKLMSRRLFCDKAPSFLAEKLETEMAGPDC